MPEGKLLFLFLVHHKEAEDDGLMKPDGQSCCAETQPWRRRRLEQHRLPLKRGNLPFSDTPRTGKLWEFHFRSHGFAQLLVWWGRSHFWILQVPVNGVPCRSWDHLISCLLLMWAAEMQVSWSQRVKNVWGAPGFEFGLVFFFPVNWYNCIDSSGNKPTFIVETLVAFPWKA